MTFEEYIAKEILAREIQSEVLGAEIWELENALEVFRRFSNGDSMFISSASNEGEKMNMAPEAPERAKEAPPPEPPAEVAAIVEIASLAPAASEDVAIVEVKPDVFEMIKKAEPIDLRKGPWSMERKARAAKEARERLAKKHGKKILPVEEPAHRRVWEPESEAQAAKVIDDGKKGDIWNKNTRVVEPPPSWAGKPALKSAIVVNPVCPLGLSGAVLLHQGKYIAHLDKWERATLEELIKHYGKTVHRSTVKGMVKNIDQVILKLQGHVGSGFVIETTQLGWRLVEAEKGAA